MSTVSASPRTGILIRRPAEEVFNAFVDPEITTNFWFTSSSGPLREGEQVEWTWGMYGISAKLAVECIDPPRKLRIRWLSGDDSTAVEWKFDTQGENGCYVSVECSGITGDCESVIASAVENVDGHAYVLASAKAWIEHGIALNLVADRFPPG